MLNQKNAEPKKCWTKKMLSKIFGIRKPYIWKNKSSKKGNNNLKNNSGRHKIRCLFLECCYILSTHSDLQYKLPLCETNKWKWCQVTEDNPISFETEINERNNSIFSNEVELEKMQPENKIK